jgi:KDO2-lipid IV(A) lauroyltransferase
MGEAKPDVTHLRPPVRVTPETKQHLKTALATGRGVFIAACHTSNFDLGGVAFAHHVQTIGQTLHVLGLADPPPGFEFFNRLREKTGAYITPICPEALREAMRRLRDGGVVLTGVDRPTGSGDTPVSFFGQTAYLPTGYIRMPIRTDSMVMTLATFYEDNAYWIHTHPPRPIVYTGNRLRDIEVNLRMVLDEVQAFIRRQPEQWMMFVPVWPPFPSASADSKREQRAATEAEG